MLLSQLLSGLDYLCDNFIDTDIHDITYNSKNADEGKCFVCIAGTLIDGHNFANEVYGNGCRCIISERELELPDDCVQIITVDTRHALAIISCNFFNNPSSDLKVIAVTGTNGKTTTAHIIKALIEANGEKCGIIGTVGAEFKDIQLDIANTTPESFELQRIFRSMVDSGCKYCVIEASSLGLKMHRTDGILFDVGVFTNLSPDHIGSIEHPTFEDYMQSKKRLFMSCKFSVVNIDDEAYKFMIEGSSAKTVTYGLSDADFSAKNVELYRKKDFLGISFDCIEDDGVFHVEAPMVGYFNVYNILAAVAVCKTLGIDVKNHIDVLRNFKVVGRAEIVRVSDDYDVIIDFAHNGRSMYSILSTLKTYPHNRLVVLFGSVGEKNQMRRKELGLVAGKEADFSIVTSDDPGNEDPMKIAEEIAACITEVGGKYIIIEDRKEAIRYAISNLKKGDILVLAGKGNETFMKIKGEKLPYSEHEEVKKYIKSISK